jgi:hypothetical protein
MHVALPARQGLPLAKPKRVEIVRGSRRRPSRFAARGAQCGSQPVSCQGAGHRAASFVRQLTIVAAELLHKAVMGLLIVQDVQGREAIPWEINDEVAGRGSKRLSGMRSQVAMMGAGSGSRDQRAACGGARRQSKAGWRDRQQEGQAGRQAPLT